MKDKVERIQHIKVGVNIIYHKCSEGGYWAEVPIIPGCVSQGDTMQETEMMIMKAIQEQEELRQDKF